MADEVSALMNTEVMASDEPITVNPAEADLLPDAVHQTMFNEVRLALPMVCAS